MAYLEAKLVETVDDIEHGSLVTLVEVDTLESLFFSQPVLFGSSIEDLDVLHGTEGRVGVVTKLDLGQSCRCSQLIDESRCVNTGSNVDMSTDKCKKLSNIAQLHTVLSACITSIFTHLHRAIPSRK